MRVLTEVVCTVLIIVHSCKDLQYICMPNANIYIRVFVVCLFVRDTTAPSGPGSPHSRGFWSHTTTHHIRQDSSGRVISWSQRPLPDNVQLSQQTNVHAHGGIRTHDLSWRAATDLILRPRGHWDLQIGIWTVYVHRTDQDVDLRQRTGPHFSSERGSDVRLYSTRCLIYGHEYREGLEPRTYWQS